jgi:hypothetical protein
MFAPKELIINAKFRDLFPPLAEEERTLLENSIRLEGCRDAIITWNNQIVDGHNRYEICNKFGISFNVKEMEFSSEGKALEWMLKNQKGRRNLADYAKAEAGLLVKSILEKEARERQGTRTDLNFGSDLTQSDDGGRTRNKISELTGISTGNLTKVEYIQSHAPEEVKDALRANSRAVRKESEKGIREFCNATEESFQKLHAFYKDLDADSRHIARELLAIGYAVDYLQFDDVAVIHHMMQQYERQIKIALNVAIEQGILPEASA